ncbi:PREDICTED: uncharacterized protein LOC104803996 [Tarenaya hassleriana]|uniref:uncharacterized protein LOC104803996 n=1 Tax=Tarenaya hassleriana TaxID=28532 RepID=UPI00053CA5B2|nr:PREDICTED: uncharacterized protein LOC104803996 [Tarenaya hassleriana]
MDPCPFVRLTVDSLALKLPETASNKPSGGGVHPSATPCYCKLRIKHFPSQTALLPLSSSSSPPESAASSPGFHLDAEALRRISGKKIPLRVSVYAGRMGRTCGVASGKLLGRVDVAVDLAAAIARTVVFHSGWKKLGGDGEKEKPSARLHLVVKAEPDPRFVFQFGGEPECSPVVFQIQGNIRQPVFSCKFSADRNGRSRSLPSGFTYSSRGWITRTLSGETREKKQAKERKGWMITIHDLSGSPVAAASMITPFVPSPGSDRVSRSNPGAWLILRPHGNSVSSWKPWGRLEAWRERGAIDGLGYSFELVRDNTTTTRIPIAEGTMSVKRGGKFSIDSKLTREIQRSSPVKGFVMGSSVEGEGKVSKPVVEVGAQHVTCMADAALFVALSAAVDLSMDACQLFSRKLRKELCHDEHCSLS